MKLPIPWLLDYLDLRGAQISKVLADACARWDLTPAADHGRTWATLFTFAGFNCDGVEGSGHDAVLELDVLANRPDAQCILGLAREAAAFLNVGLKLPVTAISEQGEPASASASVSVEDLVLCPRYTARLIRGVKIGPSPDWLQARLKSVGLTPRNNVVDVTNFILFEMNQPLHAFDLNKLNGKKIVVRRAQDKEAFKPLYGEVPVLTTETLVIADAKHPVAIAGIIGGAGSEVDANTTDLLLESAAFDPRNTRRTCRRLKVGTDSSYRFERGVDLEAVDLASARAASLIVQFAGGAIAPGLLEARAQKASERPPIGLNRSRMNKLVGFEIPAKDVQRILEVLGCKVEMEHSPASVHPPTWRSDLKKDIDLIEEVIRLHGYNHVPVVTGLSARIPSRGDLEIVIDGVRSFCASIGYFECVTDSLVDPAWPAPSVWTAEKPLAMDPRSVMREDHSALRTSLLVSLLQVNALNQDRRSGTSRLFECGKVFIPVTPGHHPAHEGPRAHGAPEERAVLGLVDDSGENGFHVLVDLLKRLGHALELDGAHLKIRPSSATVLKEQKTSFLRPESACRIVRVRETNSIHKDRAEDAVGWIGVVTPELAKAFGLKSTPAVAELNLAALAALARAPKRFEPLPTQPEVIRDVAVVVEDSTSWQEIEDFAVTHQRHDPLRDKHELPRFLNVYRGKQVGAGKKSVAFSVVYRGTDKSLTDEEVNAAHQKFLDGLMVRFKATLRM